MRVYACMYNAYVQVLTTVPVILECMVWILKNDNDLWCSKTFFNEMLCKTLQAHFNTKIQTRSINKKSHKTIHKKIK